MIKQRPVPFRTEMVLALRAGTKTQTRRIIEDCKTLNHPDSEFVGFTHSDKTGQNTLAHFRRKGGLTFFAGYNSKYGGIGDGLWVKETYTELVEPHRTESERYIYKADGSDAESEEIRQGYIKAGFPYIWKPNRFMPYLAARLFLEITNIRVERLQDISEADAIAEGVASIPVVDFKDNRLMRYQNYQRRFDIEHPMHRWTITAQHSYQTLWQKINGRDSWQANPFVWVYDFKLIPKPLV